MFEGLGSTSNDQEVVITGAAAVVAGMVGSHALWQALKRDELLANHHLPEPHRAALNGLTVGEQQVLSVQQQLGLAVGEMAWSQALLPSSRHPLRGECQPSPQDPWRLRAGVVSASALGYATALLDELAQSEGRPSATSLSRWRGNGLGAAVALRFGLRGEQLNLNSASSTGAQALAVAARCITRGEQELMVVVGAEPALPTLLMEANQRTGAIASSGSSRPLTAHRSGMVPREAAGCLVLESRQRAEARGAVVLGRVVTTASGCEAHHLVAPLPGQALSDHLLARLLQGAGGLDASAIDWICLHATGTRRFDQEELQFVRRAFPNVPWISAMKRSLGHGLGAAGVVEAVLMLEGLQRGSVPPWPDDIDPCLDWPSHPPRPAPAPRLALQLSSGMGGVVVMNLLGHA